MWTENDDANAIEPDLFVVENVFRCVVCHNLYRLQIDVKQLNFKIKKTHITMNVAWNRFVSRVDVYFLLHILRTIVHCVSPRQHPVQTKRITFYMPTPKLQPFRNKLRQDKSH